MLHHDFLHHQKLPEWLEELTSRFPALRYMGEPVATVAELYETYPRGAERGTLVFVRNKRTLYTWDFEGKEWVPAYLFYSDKDDFDKGHQEVESAYNLACVGNTIIRLTKNETLSFKDIVRLKTGYEMFIRVYNVGSSDIVLTVPDALPFENDYGEFLPLAAGDVLEITVRCFATGRYRIRCNGYFKLTVEPDDLFVDAEGNIITE
jgi:hypothetical protein